MSERERKARGEKWRTSDSGCFRFNRDFTRIGVGRITRSSRTTNEREFNRRNDILTKLAESAQIDVLRAFRTGAITIEQLVDADREQRLKSADLLGVMALQRPYGLSSQRRCRGWVRVRALESGMKSPLRHYAGNSA